MKKYVPMINCGYFSGDNPSNWNGVPFDTEEECELWISENTNGFSLDEMGGGIYPHEIEINNNEEIDEGTPTSDLVGYVLDTCSKETMLDNVECFLGDYDFRNYLLACLGKDIN